MLSTRVKQEILGGIIEISEQRQTQLGVFNIFLEPFAILRNIFSIRNQKSSFN